MTFVWRNQLTNILKSMREGRGSGEGLWGGGGSDEGDFVMMKIMYCTEHK